MEADVADLWRNAEARHARGDLAAAGHLYQQIVTRMPAHLPAWLRLSVLATRAGRYRESVATASRAAGIATDDPWLRIATCERLVEVGESRRGRDALDVLVRDARLPAQALADLAFVAHGLGEAATALALAERALAQGAREPELRYLHGTLLLFSGRATEAEVALEDVVRDAPRLASAHWTLSKLRRWSEADNHVVRLRQQLATLPSGDPAAAYLWFALFKELEDGGRDDEAWDALMAGCAAKRRHVHYDGDAEARLFDGLIARCTQGFLERATMPSPGPTPIFIVGMPRSGTTVLERILGAHPQVRDAGELHDFGHAMAWGCDHQNAQMLDETIVARAADVDYAVVAQRYLANTRWRSGGRAFYTDKLPRNFMQLGFIRRALPQARILHMVRDPMDTCFSNLKELFGAAYAYSYDFGDLARHHANYRRLMAHWHAVMPGAILDVPYAELVTDPERVARAVLAHCGLSWEPACIAIERRQAASMTASSVQVREPIQSRYLGQWQRYARQLQPLRELLAEGE
jgi:tetratricopeptide (TPR) repeat protein